MAVSTLHAISQPRSSECSASSGLFRSGVTPVGGGTNPVPILQLYSAARKRTQAPIAFATEVCSQQGSRGNDDMYCEKAIAGKDSRLLGRTKESFVGTSQFSRGEAEF